MKCKRCKKCPSEILEYRTQARLDEMGVEQWVRENEGTYKDNEFLCTECYIKVGMPLNA